MEEETRDDIGDVHKENAVNNNDVHPKKRSEHHSKEQDSDIEQVNVTNNEQISLSNQTGHIYIYIYNERWKKVIWGREGCPVIGETKEIETGENGIGKSLKEEEKPAKEKRI